MSGVDRVNRELARLDAELRAGGIDLPGFRAHRRRVLLDFEERQTTTTPGALAGGGETTVVDTPDPPFLLPEPPPASAVPAAATRRIPALGAAALAIGALVVLVLAGWWMFRSKPEGGAERAAAGTAVTRSAPAVAGAESPQDVASFLLGTEWTDADVVEFLRRWSELTPESIRAASEDSKIWLLRGETARRLREAREAESVEHSAEMLVRVQQLEQVDSTLRTP